jgi:LytS/YehU family sensor histidine kinase
VLFALEEQRGEEQQTGIGLYNVDKRLRLYYGEEHKLIIENTSAGVRIMLRIPKIPREDTI